MAGFLVALAIGVALFLVLSRMRASQAQASPAAPLQDPSARLQELGAALSSAGDASSHPRDLGSNPTFREAVAILESPDVPMSLVMDYAMGANWMPATVACAALCGRSDRDAASAPMARHFRHLSPWPMYYALQYFTKVTERPAVGSLVLHGPEYWTQHPLVPALLAEHFRARADLQDTPGFADSLPDATPEVLTAAETLLRKIDHPTAPVLIADLTAWRQRTLDREFLQAFGRFVERAPELELLVEHDAIKEPLVSAEAFALNDPFRSVLVVGEPRAGKTSFLMLLAARAAARGWSVFEAGAASLMAGQQYFGQLEERLRRLTTELAVEKRVLWYVPDFLQLFAGGTHTSQSASLLDQVLPAIVAGRIVVVSETTAAALTSMLQGRPALRSAVELVRLRPLTDAESDALARDLADRVSAVAEIEIPQAVTSSAMHLARHYLGTGQMPGTALDLIKLTAHRVAAHDGASMDRQDVLVTLSQLTGMPQLVLDDRERVELAAIRRYFAARVIGQDEAVNVVVDRIAMLKAGLTDPGRPIAVFLFAGPTGTGKTELAKTLAEFLFGSPDRLIRLDMSEFQTVESTRKILGEAEQQTNGQALTHRVRKQPFSVVLLDEFEKAHPNAWDLFLQVFDDGRLTDATGQTVDFRHCIIVLTSNVGATIQQQAGPGFASTTGAFSQDHVTRAVHQSFRPEFVNRLDAIIVFRPLTRDLMRGILAKELARVLERRGLKHREWAVEWESSALDFLLDKGFSPAMGARPLKRAIDRHLLAPLAATLVEHRFPEGDQFLFVRSDGRAIQVEFVDPDAPPEPAPRLESEPVAVSNLTNARMMLQASGLPEERASLLAELQQIEARLADGPWSEVEASLVADMARPDFWNRPERFDVLSRYALIDRVKAAVGTARGLETRLSRSAGRDGRHSRDLISRLASQLYLVQHGIEDVLTESPVEVVLSVQPVLDAGPDPASSARWCERLLDTYRQWASRRQMQWDIVPGASSTPSLAVVSGFGAARILGREAGLHVLEYEDAREESARAAARVRVAPTPAVVPDAAEERRPALLSELNRVPAVASVVRRYRLDSSPLIRDATYGWRTGRQDLVLGGDFDLLADILGAAK
jgi:ATP-dependent Clp protease ATP-binding subunit ClpC